MTALTKFEDLNIPALTEIAKEQYEECVWAIEKSLKKQLEFGRVLLIVKGKLPHGEWGNWVRETFSDHKSLRTVQRHMRGASAIATDLSLLESADSLDGILKIVEERKPTVEDIEVATSVPEAEPVVAELLIPSDESAVEIDSVTRTSRPHVANNSGQNEWYTPPAFIEAATQVMGGIDLDPASSAIANKTVRAKKFYTSTQDGLTKKWAGTVFLNPPYAQPLISQFAKKLADSVTAGLVTEAIILVNNATETDWWQTIAAVSSAVCFPKSRIRFLDPEGNLGGAPLQGQAILYCGANADGFAVVHESIGTVFLPQKKPASKRGNE